MLFCYMTKGLHATSSHDSEMVVGGKKRGVNLPLFAMLTLITDKTF